MAIFHGSVREGSASSFHYTESTPFRSVLPHYNIRQAASGDMPAIRTLIKLYPRQLVQKEIPGLASFFVAEAEAGRIIGCCALQIYSKRLAEVRTLAVHPEMAGKGVGKALVAACQQRAQERKIKQVLTVTGSPEFFQRFGFSTFYGEKIALFWDVPQGE